MQQLRRLLAPLVLIILVGLAVLGWFNRWDIYDYLRLRNYTPPPDVVKLADTTTMTADARRLFYVYYPTIQDKEIFRGSCNRAEQTIVLGCYIGGQGIYLAHITEERLEGIVEVTAAHEVLHAAFERLSAAEKTRIGKLLDNAYTEVANERIRKNVDEYKANGDDVINELHSILGTEVRKLPDELETYYKGYFNDRQAIVALSERYEEAFTSLENEAKELESEAKALSGEIDAINASLKEQVAAIERGRAQLDSLANSGKVDEYNAAVPGFNALIHRYNADVNLVNAKINEYNLIVARIKELALTQNELFEAIDSRPKAVEAE